MVRRNLSKRLKEILDLVATGQTDKQVAQSLCISPDTVETHWKRLRKIYDSSSRTEIVVRYLREHQGAPQTQGAEVDALREQVDHYRVREAVLQEALSKQSEGLERRDELLLRSIAESSQFQKRYRWLETVERSIVALPNVFVYHSEFGGDWKTHGMSDNLTSLDLGKEGIDHTTIGFGAFCSMEDLVLAELAIPRILEKKARCVILEYRMKGQDGKVRWYRDHIVIRRNDAGAELDYTGLLVDITDLKIANGEQSARAPVYFDESR